MLFSSWQFIFLFLPVCWWGYFWLNQRRLIIAGKTWLVGASLFFYGYWDVRYLALICGSILFNFAIGSAMARSADGSKIDRKAILVFGVVANLLLLGYYKYTHFFLTNINTLFGTRFPAIEMVLPLAISFFTFTQIVYLVDSYRRETADYDLLNYALFVTFFPHLIAGPIVQHSQIMPQFASRWTLLPRWSNVLRGLFIFAIGLFKKVVIADSFAVWADAGFDGNNTLTFFSAWATSLSYTFQLYFDFSGYCDMAIGASLLFNIWLPQNFDSPYKALDIQDFWRRWHITLGAFLRDYIYIPLGGSRTGSARTYCNLLVTFALGGLWHGATWMFVIWGALHGAALCVHRLWKHLGGNLPRSVSWSLTFLFVSVSWVFFRARTMDDAVRVLSGMGDISSGVRISVSALPSADLAWGGVMSDTLLRWIPPGLVGHLGIYAMIILALGILGRKNAFELAGGALRSRHVAYGVALFAVAVLWMMASTSTVFLYFNF